MNQPPKTYERSVTVTERTDCMVVIWPDGSHHGDYPKDDHDQDVRDGCRVSIIDTPVMDPGTIYLLTWAEGLAEARFLCPCGCGERYDLSLKPAKANPYADWDAAVEPSGRVTLSPSVNNTGGCRSHFFIRDGVVQWC